MLRKNKGAEGSSNALNAGGSAQNSEASSAVWISIAVRLHALTVGVGSVSGDAVADHVSECVISEDTVGRCVTVGALGG